MGNNESCVLFLHGWGGSTNSFFNVAEKLSGDHKVILLDFYGFGKTKYPNVILDCYDYALQVYLFLKRKNITKLSIVAHSFGGRIAIILASVFDIEITKLVLVDSAGLKPHHGLCYHVKVMKYKILKRCLRKSNKSRKLLKKYGSEEYRKLDELQKKGYVKIVNQDLKFLLKNINNNTLIVWGENDKTTPISMAKKLNKGISNSRLYLYKNSGHFCFLENYVNFIALLKTYLGGVKNA